MRIEIQSKTFALEMLVRSRIVDKAAVGLWGPAENHFTILRVPNIELIMAHIFPDEQEVIPTWMR